MSKILDAITKAAGAQTDLIRGVADVKAASPPPAEPAAAEAAPVTGIRTVRLRVAAGSPLLPFEKGQWRPSEQYRILRTKLGQHPKQPRMIVISSPAPGDGKSVTAINTAAALSLKSDSEVLLVDVDLRKPAIHRQLGLEESPGLAEVLTGDCAVEEALVRTAEFPSLFILPAGAVPSNPVELLDSPNWPAVCARLRSLFRYVILDSPPLGAVADYDLIQAVCDGVILVVRPDHTNRDLCDRALKTVTKSKFLGVLLNCVPEWSFAKRSGADYYYYSGEKNYQRPQEDGRS